MSSKIIYMCILLMFLIGRSYCIGGDSSIVRNLLIANLITNNQDEDQSQSLGPVLSTLNISLFRDYNREDKHLNITQLIDKYGFKNEVHEVITEDGYVLTAHRIPSNGSVVIVKHGSTCSSNDFVTAGPESALAYVLSRAGYDVWLCNSRGNKHSRNHTTLSTDSRAYWNFTWDEIGRYDLPAFIDYILKIRTDRSQVAYIGHSQATAEFIVMASERPEYNEKVSIAIFMSVVAYMENIDSKLLKLMIETSQIETLMDFGIYSWDADSTSVRLAQALCSTPFTAALICSTFAFLFAGFNYPQMNVTNLPVIYNHFPGGIGLMPPHHYAQIYESKKFRRYDYGLIKNLQKYGKAAPPEYQVEKVTAKVVVIHADNDWVSNFKDVKKIIDRLPNVVDVYRVPDERFNHLDYMFAKDVKPLVYDKVLDYLAEH